jgi:hypothetical protein
VNINTLQSHIYNRITKVKDSRNATHSSRNVRIIQKKIHQWTEEEKKKLVAGKNEGLSFEQIHAKYLPNRTFGAIRVAWNKYEKQQSSPEQNYEPSILNTPSSEFAALELLSLSGKQGSNGNQAAENSLTPSAAASIKNNFWNEQNKKTLILGRYYLGLPREEVKRQFFPELQLSEIDLQLKQMTDTEKSQLLTTIEEEDDNEAFEWTDENKKKLLKALYDEYMDISTAQIKYFPELSVEAIKQQLKHMEDFDTDNTARLLEEIEHEDIQTW